MFTVGIFAGVFLQLQPSALGQTSQPVVERPTSAASESWQAGVAKVKITPREPLWMSGYASRNKPAVGKLTDLWAKVLVIRDPQGNSLVLVTLDLIGIGRRMSRAICDELETRLKLRREQIAICTSHTHTGPALDDNLMPLHYLVVEPEQQKRIRKYSAELRGKIVAVVEQAIERVQPAVIAWGSGRASFAVNRRNNREADVPELRKENKLVGPVDHDVPVLSVRGSKGQLKAIVFGYACHATTLSFYRWSGDYPGFAQIELEKRYSGCQAMFWAGCGADQNPLPRRTVELAKDYGQQLATSVAKVLDSDMKTITGGLAARYREVKLPLSKLPSREMIERDAQSENRFVAARARFLLSQLKDGPLATTYPYPVQSWQLGELQWVFLGGEVVVDFAIQLKMNWKGTQTWVAAYSNDVMAYIASRRVLREGGYEGGGAMVYYGLPSAWALESEEVIVTEVNRQLKALTLNMSPD